MKTKTFLPLFSGFYGTIWETDNDEEMELENINELRQEQNLTPVTWDDLEFDYASHHREVSKAFTNWLEGELVGLKVIKSFKHERLNSPRQYNFSNDSIDVMATFTLDNLKVIEGYLKKYKTEFEKYIENKYTSYDGFMSFYSNNAEVWLAEGIKELMKHEHKAGSVLEFICQMEDIREYDGYEHVKGNGGYLQASNYSELVPRLKEVAS